MRAVKSWLGLAGMIAAAAAGTIAFFSHYATASQVEAMQSEVRQETDRVSEHASVLAAIRESLADNKSDHQQMIEDIRQIKNQLFQLNHRR